MLVKNMTFETEMYDQTGKKVEMIYTIPLACFPQGLYANIKEIDKSVPFEILRAENSSEDSVTTLIKGNLAHLKGAVPIYTSEPIEKDKKEFFENMANDLINDYEKYLRSRDASRDE